MPLNSTPETPEKNHDRYRVGIVVVDNDPVPEMEINRLAPLGVSIHVSRFRLPREIGEEFLGDQIPAQQPGAHLVAALETLNRIGVDAVGLCFTSSSIFDPETFDKSFINAALEINGDWNVATAAQAIISDMERKGARSPYIVVPPWFTTPTIDALMSYLKLYDIGSSGFHQHELGTTWDAYPRQDRFDLGAKWEIQPRQLVDDLHSRNLMGADSILIPGSGFPSLDLLSKEPAQPPLPLFSANKSLLNELLRQAH
ncbi:hypothetical protein [Arthrobacter antibioticus]|uniref:hypothetical protein n=1 Tax=Arthrobacter sp. H35-MC1 TaxID=3046203 RepID=UPI0024B9571C|nr:hypothetical protein [Arthrobacter sp. H35-MC1]MDJ0318691.1 hypothetical protein [Arthrobacter sp. H35-MC1]